MKNVREMGRRWEGDEEFDKKPITYYDLIWTSLFLANHKDEIGRAHV